MLRLVLFLLIVLALTSCQSTIREPATLIEKAQPYIGMDWE